ncbi:hypothetical protein JTE90_021126 [Oedothorax gibbosus]|uniref:Uncharacterized protein n=1 Tax=Oedothorax gibbosus TaxID=931172 RepID=A0AAV6TXI9_9ARAC|nr:hypothetical protein JTE90_021126 [Oedothorax gibbosus]
MPPASPKNLFKSRVARPVRQGPEVGRIDEEPADLLGVGPREQVDPGFLVVVRVPWDGLEGGEPFSTREIRSLPTSSAISSFIPLLTRTSDRSAE